MPITRTISFVRSSPAAATRRTVHEPTRRLVCVAAALLMSILLVQRCVAGDGHGWAILADEPRPSSGDDTIRSVLLHLPPTSPGARQGTVRAAQWLLKEPERLCWQDNRVYMVMPSETVITETRREIRRVLSIETNYSIAGVWTYLPQDGPELLPSLPGEGELVGLAGTPAGPVALLRLPQVEPPATVSGLAGAIIRSTDPKDAPVAARTEPEPSAHWTWRLLMLDGRDWIELSLPWPDPSAESDRGSPLLHRDAQNFLFPTPGGVAIFSHGWSQTDASCWTARLTRRVDTQASASAPDVTWTSETFPLRLPPGTAPGGTATPGVLAFDSVVGVDGRPVAVTYRDSVFTAYLLLKDGPVQIARKEGVTPGYRVIPRGTASLEGGSSAGGVDRSAGGASGGGGNGVLSVLWPEKAAGDADAASPGTHADAAKARPRSPRAFRLFECFATGRVLYDGPARQDGPLSIREVQLLSIILGGVLIAVIAFVLRPEQRPNERLLRLLPRGFVVAGTSRRAIATLLDLTVGIVAARAVLGQDWSQVLDPGHIGSQQGGLMLLATGLALTWLHTTVMEWQLGTTLGKLLVDCRVVSLRPRPPHSVARRGTPRPRDGQADGSGSPPVSPPAIDGAEPGAPDTEAPVESAGVAAADPSRFKLTLWQAATRNLLKWIPPLSLAVFIGPRPRHFADQAAGTVVVEPEVKERQAGE